MITTVEYLDELPPWRDGEQLPKPWLEFCTNAFEVAYPDLYKLIAAARAGTDPKLLKYVQFHESLWARPSHNLGSIRVLPDEAYLLKSKQPTYAERLEASTRGHPSLGLEIEVDLYRPYPATHLGPDMVIALGVTTALNLHGGIELETFRDIFKNYRGIIAKLLDGSLIEFFSHCVIPEVEAVRSKKPINKLDGYFSAKNLNPDNQWFELSYGWYPRRTYDQGLNAFLIQAILFTCIQQAAAAPRSAKDQILEYWDLLKRARKHSGA